MIPIDKNRMPFPESLNSDLTCKKRRDVIGAGEYPPKGGKAGTYNAAYKQDDIKKALLALYHGKCCYCEKDISDHDSTIEHYRPKSVYYWLAYSWDNLLLCCKRCNTLKRAHFALQGQKVVYSAQDLPNIHALAFDYQAMEQPMMVHPELENIQDKLQFTKAGEISSEDSRVDHTIKTCEIDRKEANEARQRIVAELIEHYKDVAYRWSGQSREGYKKELKKYVLEKFIAASQNKELPYLALRQYVVKNMKKFLS